MSNGEQKDRERISDMKRLTRSSHDAMIAGVCGGLGRYFGMDSTVIRLVWVIASVMLGGIPGVAAYIAAAVIMPRDETD